MHLRRVSHTHCSLPEPENASLGIIEIAGEPPSSDEVWPLSMERTKNLGCQTASRISATGICIGRKRGYRRRNVPSQSSFSTCVRTGVRDPQPAALREDSVKIHGRLLRETDSGAKEWKPSELFHRE